MITIVATEGTRTFVTEASQYNEKLDVNTRNPTGETVNVGAFRGERFPNSHQMFRPVWSYSKKRWMVEGLDQGQVNKLVEELKFTHLTGAHEGDYITIADLRNFRDPFFNHKDVKMVFKEGKYSIDPEAEFDELLLACLKGSEEFREPNEQNGIKQIRGRYTILDPEGEKADRAETRDKRVEATLRYSKLSPSEKVKIALAMNLGVSDTTDPELVDEVLFRQIDDDSTAIANGETPIDIFLRIAEGDPEELHILYLIGLGRRKGIIKKTKAGYTMLGNKVGRTLTDVKNYFVDSDNQDAFDHLENLITDD